MDRIPQSGTCGIAPSCTWDVSAGFAVRASRVRTGTYRRTCRLQPPHMVCTTLSCICLHSGVSQGWPEPAPRMPSLIFCAAVFVVVVAVGASTVATGLTVAVVAVGAGAGWEYVGSAPAPV